MNRKQKTLNPVYETKYSRLSSRGYWHHEELCHQLFKLAKLTSNDIVYQSLKDEKETSSQIVARETKR
jgi:hypothetical protein